MWIVLVVLALLLAGGAVAVFLEFRTSRVSSRDGRPAGTILSRARNARRDLETYSAASSRFRNPSWRD
ncbi:hypothetical protein [Jatrophihabitans endophyticus]|uniref:hypothetical protein n=1 Tax=Jatrophihabitans endophyticus TaxID=1206085 RepID=UPI0019F5034D|nr:hypothetical protein [Jatrophihabitans endophyticus]MBE7187809.1 hypothetical protein [Jatrophihabitans endophyticus]